MSTPDVANILRLPGKLSHSPTSLATAYPHGGTALGTVGRRRWRPMIPPFVVTAWEWGGAPCEVIQGGGAWVLEGELREFDADALAALLPQYAAGAQGGPTLKLKANVDATRAGVSLGTSLGKVVVFTPDGLDDLPLVLFRRGVPAPADDVSFALSGAESGALKFRWYATPDSAGLVADVGMRRDLTL